jgi:hypothetical protein
VGVAPADGYSVVKWTAGTVREVQSYTMVVTGLLAVRVPLATSVTQEGRKENNRDSKSGCFHTSVYMHSRIVSHHLTYDLQLGQDHHDSDLREPHLLAHSTRRKGGILLENASPVGGDIVLQALDEVDVTHNTHLPANPCHHAVTDAVVRTRCAWRANEADKLAVGHAVECGHGRGASTSCQAKVIALADAAHVLDNEAGVHRGDSGLLRRHSPESIGRGVISRDDPARRIGAVAKSD